MIGFHTAAAEEMAEAAEWYESRAAGLGSRFLDGVQAALATLNEHPKLGGIWGDPALPGDVEVRRFPLRVFPFLIVYVLNPEPTIIAVAHGRRRPGYWVDRVQESRGPTG